MIFYSAPVKLRPPTLLRGNNLGRAITGVRPKDIKIFLKRPVTIIGMRTAVATYTPENKLQNQETHHGDKIMKRTFLTGILMMFLFAGGTIALAQNRETTQALVIMSVDQSDNVRQVALSETEPGQPATVPVDMPAPEPRLQFALATINGLEVVDPDPECGKTFTVHVNVTNQSDVSASPGTVTLQNVHRGSGNITYTGFENYPSIPPGGNYIVPFRVKMNIYQSRGQELRASTNGSTFTTKYDIRQGNCSKNSGSSGGSGYALQARHSHKCMDVEQSSTVTGALVQQYSCHGGANQQWTLQPLGNGYYQIVALHSGQCLDVKGAATYDQAVVQQHPCHSGDNQQFRLEPTDSGYYSIIARHSGKCLDVKGLSLDDGAPVQKYWCNRGTNQQWQLR